MPSRLFGFCGLFLTFVTAARAEEPKVPEDWAYKPVVKRTVPTVRGKVTSPVDAFLLAKLESRNLTFAPAADKATLLRRVTFDLTGLPPTPNELDAFLKDDSATAYEKVVDRLLASPRFGEKAALWWLDLVRFAETDGFKADDPRPNAWRYRDYVIESLNADKPFDRFVKEQLAGDELFPGNPAALVATGFLRHFPYEANGVDVELKRQDMLNDITDTAAATFLGVTLGCAKCHDHKFDPITQADYYRTQAFFAGFLPADRSLTHSEDRDRAEAEWETKTAELRMQMAAIEKPIREKAQAKERKRFPDEYATLLDIPEGKRTPLQKQLAFLVGKQVYNRAKVDPKQMSAADKKKYDGMMKRMKELEKSKPAAGPTAMAMSEIGTECPPTHILRRGNWHNPTTEVKPGYLSALDDRDASVTPLKSSSGRRSALANWIASDKNPLTSRVLVNRIWQQLFGRGIVATPNDFGVSGERPTHLELLDWLAHEFVNPARKGGGVIAKPWSMKHVYRLLVTSAAYRQASRGTTSGATIDPDNKLLWKMPSKRLDGESLRDAVLSVAGIINYKAGGPGVHPELPAEMKPGTWKVSTDAAERNRRSVYVYVKRNLRYPFFAAFDAPDRNETCGRRFVTTTAPQALMLLNDSLLLGYAKTFAARVRKEAGNDPDKVIARAFRLALGREPDTEEKAAVEAFIKNRKGSFESAVTDLCHSLLNLNEFVYVD
ncbi:MAG TPA: DUF1549 and DUF1553 domain-containing protein [Fimbriiglobus sp.]|jgi:hypothetical protein